jgi:hypothetical protein
MRKKKHFKISARNRIYDKYYVINYLVSNTLYASLVAYSDVALGTRFELGDTRIREI